VEFGDGGADRGELGVGIRTGHRPEGRLGGPAEEAVDGKVERHAELLVRWLRLPAVALGRCLGRSLGRCQFIARSQRFAGSSCSRYGDAVTQVLEGRMVQWSDLAQIIGGDRLSWAASLKSVIAGCPRRQAGKVGRDDCIDAQERELAEGVGSIANVDFTVSFEAV
jgi:hypothetical protein